MHTEHTSGYEVRVWQVHYPSFGGSWRWRVATPRQVMAEGRTYDEATALQSARSAAKVHADSTHTHAATMQRFQEVYDLALDQLL